MTIQKIGAIVVNLKKLTEKGKLEWEKTEKADVFQLAFPNFTIRISKRPSEVEPEDDYIISVIDSEGVEIESMSDVDLKSIYTLPGEAYRMMKYIWESARGYALGVEQTLDIIIKELEKKGSGFV